MEKCKDLTIAELQQKVAKLEYLNEELKQWRSEDQSAIEQKDHEIVKLQQRVKELEARLKLADELAQDYDTLEAKLQEAEKVIQKFITKSNGLSFYCREPSMQTELFLKYPTLIEKLQGLYDFQCDVEQTYLQNKGE